MYQVSYLKPKKKGYSKQIATLLTIDDAEFWYKVVESQGAREIKILVKWNLDPLKCCSNVSNPPSMDSFDDIQIEDFSSFDFVEEMNEGIFDDEDDEKTFNAFLNSNWDFWSMKPSEVMHQLKELQETWRKQSFCFSDAQQQQYDKLLVLRRARVIELYKSGRVYKAGANK